VQKLGACGPILAFLLQPIILSPSAVDFVGGLLPCGQLIYLLPAEMAKHPISIWQSSSEI